MSNVPAAASWNPFELLDRGVAAAAGLSGAATPRAGKVLPASLDTFGWCTWDAFYSTVSAQGLQQGLKSLHDAGRAGALNNLRLPSLAACKPHQREVDSANR